MIIQINTDKTINGDHKMREYFTSQIKTSLARHASHISRIEIHVKDENGTKDGIGDVSCMLEARINGRQPIVTTSQADTMELALAGSIGKVEAALASILGRIQSH
ncbi:MAG: hypothetical protein ACI86M_000656 [Saprospiraceae bacterium]|jgi:hypothetical protein